MIKTLSPCVKDECSLFSSSYIDVMWVWVCDVVERGTTKSDQVS